MTFLCTDFISELYGKKRASFLVWVGLVVNLWLALILWIGGTPSRFLVVDALPRNAMGKVTKPAVAKLFEES